MLYHDKPRPRPGKRALQWAVVAALCALLCWQGSVLYRLVATDLDAQAAALLRQTVLTAAVQCYAVEGAYPPSLDYLQQNYGVQINRQRYIVTYEVFAANVLPDVAVLQR